MHDANQITLLDTKINSQFLKKKIISKITEKTPKNPKKSLTGEKSLGKLDAVTAKLDTREIWTRPKRVLRDLLLEFY